MHWNRILDFQQYIAIDWSGAKMPVRNKSISIAQMQGGALTLYDKVWSRQAVADFILHKANEKGPFLIGIDANFSFCAQAVEFFCGTQKTAFDLWCNVDQMSMNAPNFFAGEIWQDSEAKRLFWTQGKQPEGFNPYPRQTDLCCAAKGLGHPESPFKLIGAKQVGKGGLAAMRMLSFLKKKLGKKICCWPFEPYYPDTKIILCEIYPRLFLRSLGLGGEKVRDENVLTRFFDTQKISYAKIPSSNLTDHQTDALISAYALSVFDRNPAVWQPEGLSFDTARTEGWIFGV